VPIFDFRCRRCEHTFEAILLSRDEEVRCPTCDSPEIVKLVSPIAPPPQSQALVKQARAQAAREGHFSNYAASERPKT